MHSFSECCSCSGRWLYTGVRLDAARAEKLDGVVDILKQVAMEFDQPEGKKREIEQAKNEIMDHAMGADGRLVYSVMESVLTFANSMPIKDRVSQFFA